MQTTVKTVQEFLTAIGFSSYADVNKIYIQGDVVTVSLNEYGDITQDYQDMAKKFGFEAVESKSEDTTEYLVNVPEKGSFGFVKHNSTQAVTFVIYNQKYASKYADLKDIFPNLLNKVEEVLTPHIQSIREMFTINKESLKNETPEQKEKNDSAVEKAFSPFVKAMREKYFGAQKTEVKPEVQAEEGSGVTFEKLPNGKLVIKQNGKVVGHQG
jgi:hypothetical protein